MLNTSVLILLAAFVTTIASAAGKCPLWVSVLLLVVLQLLETFGR